MSCSARCRTLPPAAVAVLLAAGAPAPAAAQVPPDEAWRTFETEHFRITFPEHLEELAARTADVAERAHAALSAGFRAGPRGTIEVVLTDHIDVSNGSAAYSPWNRIVLYARPPVDHPALAYFDDWLEQLVVHELAHIFHLDYGGGVGGFFRALFGRQPLPGSIITFPGTNVPSWVVEGLATWYESALTAGGRVHGTYHEMVLRTAALEGRFESMGQAGGNSPQWPGGGRRYVYGSLFFEYLLEKHGRDRMAELVEEVARNGILPRRVLDVPLTAEWDAWRDEMRAGVEGLDAELARLGPVTEPEALTRGARQGLHPAVSPDGGRLVYVRSDGRSDPRLAAMPPGGGDGSTLTRTNNLTRFDFLPGGGIVFAQREYADRYRRYSDLYVLTPAGSVRRVTEGARLTAPSAGPGGAWAVAVAEGGGTAGLARVDLATGAVDEIAAPVPGVYWAYPAVSPDGRWIAASRWTEGRHDLVILDGNGGPAHEVTRDHALDLAPAWTADGRHLVWSSDRTGIPNILAVEVDPRTGAPGIPRLLTNVRTGAAFPSVDPAGEWLYFSGYHVDGWEIERVPFAPGPAPPAPPPAARFDEGAPATVLPAAALLDAPTASAAAGPDTSANPAELADQDGRAAPDDGPADQDVPGGRDEPTDQDGGPADQHDGPANQDAAPGGRDDAAEQDMPRGRETPGGRDDATAAPPPAGTTPVSGDPNNPERRDGDRAVRGYSPFPTLWPRYWVPSLRPPVAVAAKTVGGVEVPRTEVLGRGFGGRTSGLDVVGRHAWAGGARYFPSGGRREGDVSYEYRGLGNPTIGLSAAQRWGHDGVRVVDAAAGTGEESAPETFFVLDRERSVAASVGIRRPGYRTSLGLTISAGLVRSDREALDADLQPTGGYRPARPGATSSELAVALSASTARSHAFQLGNARGVEADLFARTRRDLTRRASPAAPLAAQPLGAADAGRAWLDDRSVDALFGRFAAYLPLPLPGFAAPVLAVRANAGAARGPATRTGYFAVGGFGGFGSVRGRDPAARDGSRAWSASVELRAPLALINRGAGIWPLHVDRLFGSVFLDAGDAWDPADPSAASPPRRRPLWSLGVELTTHLAVFYRSVLPLRVGLAAVRDEARGVYEPKVYIDFGVPF